VICRNFLPQGFREIPDDAPVTIATLSTNFAVMVSCLNRFVQEAIGKG